MLWVKFYCILQQFEIKTNLYDNWHCSFCAKIWNQWGQSLRIPPQKSIFVEVPIPGIYDQYFGCSCHLMLASFRTWLSKIARYSVYDSYIKSTTEEFLFFYNRRSEFYSSLTGINGFLLRGAVWPDDYIIFEYLAI